MTACTWVSSKWDHRAPPDHVLFRCFVGDTAPGAEAKRSTVCELIWE